MHNQNISSIFVLFFFNYINKPLRRVFGSILEGRSSLISSLNLHNQNISSIFTLFCFCFCYQIVPKLTARHFFAP